MAIRYTGTSKPKSIFHTRGRSVSGPGVCLLMVVLAGPSSAVDPHADPAGTPSAAAAVADGHAAAAADAAGQAPAVGHPDSPFAGGLTFEPVAGDEATDPFTRWFMALESAAAEAAAGPATGPLLFPLDGAPQLPHAAQPYRHLAIAKALTQLEATPGNQATGHGDQQAGASPTHGEEQHAAGHDGGGAGSAAGSPLLALANARNYLNLSEYDQALAWYSRAQARDPQGLFRRETGRETLAAAICARDTVAAGKAIASTMAAPDAAGREGEFVLAMRWLLSRQDGATLAWFVERAAAPELAADVRVSFWRAYSLSWLERRAECLVELRRLLEMGGRERVLGLRERGWVLTAYADLHLLEGDRAEAERRYGQLSHSGLPTVRDWGRLQGAGLAFVGNRYGEAAAGFREICQAEAQGAWAEHACAMADIAARLERLLSEGERYGAAAHYGH